MNLIVIDPHVTRKSPSMRAWLDAFPRFRELFDRVEIWASESELDEGPGLTWRRFPKRMPVWTLHAMDFQYRVRSAMRKIQPSKDTIIQVTGCTAESADIRYIHYWNNAMLEERAKRPEGLALNPVQRLGAEWSALTERKVAASANATGWWWVVSQSISDRIANEAKGGQFRILPNQYDPARFNHGVRERWRSEMRDCYGISADEPVLAFSAFGHFERKGLVQAVQALNILRQRGHKIRLLILGGSPRTLRSFKARLRKASISENGCIFAGLVDHMERHLSAADGFFFPSHFEAFSLAEIESAALGLRLYLTAHYGIEMILREPSNGRLLPWDPAQMADVIEDDIRSGGFGTFHGEAGEAITPADYQKRIFSLYEEAIAAKKSGGRIQPVP